MTSRRKAAAWASSTRVPEPVLEVLIPTAGRTAELAVTLAGLAAQDDPPFRVLVSDQSDTDVSREPAVAAMARVLRAQGRDCRFLRHLPRRGIAEQRDFLLAHAQAPAVLFLDDDVWLEPGALQTLHDALERTDAGFVGMAVQGLSYLEDERPWEWQRFEAWPGSVHPERVRRGTAGYERWPLHNAANLVHIAARVELPAQGWLAYRVAWIGGCVLYRTTVLREVGGFSFWRQLPPEHSGEEVLAQWRVMAVRGGAGILPSGAVHLEAPTTLPHRRVEAYDVAGEGT